MAKDRLMYDWYFKRAHDGIETLQKKNRWLTDIRRVFKAIEGRKPVDNWEMSTYDWVPAMADGVAVRQLLHRDGTA